MSIPPKKISPVEEEIDWGAWDDVPPLEASDVFDGDECPHCHSVETIRIDVISDCPDIWHCECTDCEQGFEVIGNRDCEEEEPDFDEIYRQSLIDQLPPDEQGAAASL